jgi:hypothetical protein
MSQPRRGKHHGTLLKPPTPTTLHAACQWLGGCRSQPCTRPSLSLSSAHRPARCTVSFRRCHRTALALTSVLQPAAPHGPQADITGLTLTHFPAPHTHAVYRSADWPRLCGGGVWRWPPAAHHATRLRCWSCRLLWRLITQPDAQPPPRHERRHVCSWSWDGQHQGWPGQPGRHGGRRWHAAESGHGWPGLARAVHDEPVIWCDVLSCHAQAGLRPLVLGGFHEMCVRWWRDSTDPACVRDLCVTTTALDCIDVLRQACAVARGPASD